MTTAAVRGRSETILVVAPAWVGDLVMCQTLLKVLAARRPRPALDVLAPDWGVSLVERMPEVRRTLSLAVGHGQLGLGRRWRAAKELRGRGYDQAIVIQRSFKAGLVPWMAGVPRRTGVRGEARYGLINDARAVTADTHALNHARYAALGLEPGETIDDGRLPEPSLHVNEANLHRLIDRLGLDAGIRPVGLAPGAAYGPAKRWPETYWVRLAESLVRSGRGVWVFGSEAERAVGERIREAAPSGVWNLAGRTRLVDAVDLMSACREVVSNDSGLMHLAAAAGAHVVALFGSTSPSSTPPLTRRRTLLWRGLECSPCFARECPLGHLACLTGISPEAVLEALAESGGVEV